MNRVESLRRILGRSRRVAQKTVCARLAVVCRHVINSTAGFGAAPMTVNNRQIAGQGQVNNCLKCGSEASLQHFASGYHRWLGA